MKQAYMLCKDERHIQFSLAPSIKIYRKNLLEYKVQHYYYI